MILRFIIIIAVILFFVLFFVRVKDQHIPSYYEIIKDKTNIPVIKVLVFENMDTVDISIENQFYILRTLSKVLRPNIKKDLIFQLFITFSPQEILHERSRSGSVARLANGL